MITFLCSPYHRGGVTRWMVDIAIQWAKTEQVYFISVEPQKPFISSGGKETVLELLSKEHNNVNVVKKVVGWQFEFGSLEYRSFVYAGLVRSYILEGSPIILGNDTAIWNVARVLAPKYKFIAVLHSDEAAFYQNAERFHSFMHSLVCVSTRIANNLLDICPRIDSAKVNVIPCGIILPQIKIQPNQKKMLEFVYLGRVQEYQKRKSDLLKMAIRLKQQGCAFHLHVIGSGEVDELNEMFTTNNLRDSVSFYGWLSKEQIYERLTEFDLLLLTSDFEGMPVAMMEAMACGCGVVATRVSGIEDYENTPIAEDCLWVYAIGDIEDAIKKVKQAVSIPKYYRQQAAVKMAVSEFRMDVCIERYKMILNKTIDLPIHSSTKSLKISELLKSYFLAVVRIVRVLYIKK